MIKQPKNASEAFMMKQESIRKAIDRKEASIDSWAGMHDAVALAIAILGHEKESTREDYEKEIDRWLEWLVKRAGEMKDWLSIPVVEDISLDAEKSAEQWNEKKQEVYEETSKRDDELPLIEP